MVHKIRRPGHVTVADFFSRHRDVLQLSLLGSDAGFARRISEPTINRPGLALSGFFTYFAYKRVQVMGNSERSYLHTCKLADRTAHFEELCAREVPCIIVSRGKTIPADLMRIAEEARISVFQTQMITMKFVNAATILLEADFAPSCSEHGSMIDVQGIGILLRGKSGSGKSETVISLLGRGASLVADDLVHLKAIEGRELMATAPELGRNHMEVRGIGLINVTGIFGIGAMRLQKRLDLVIDLKAAKDLNEVERVGLAKRNCTILGIDVPMVELPVAPGRDIARLVGIAALDQKLKGFGHDAAIEFDKKLLKKMAENTIY
ncbi:HPr(Ser) kinase/phosphatase [soil metagenome]